MLSRNVILIIPDSIDNQFEPTLCSDTDCQLKLVCNGQDQINRNELLFSLGFFYLLHMNAASFISSVPGLGRLYITKRSL